MKTTKVLFVAMLLSLAFMWSCQKEGSMTPDASGSQTFADSESANSGDGSGLSDIESAFIADLQDQLDSLEANFEPNTQVSYQNSNNPYDYVGIKHNEFVSYVSTKLKEVRNDSTLTVSYDYATITEGGNQSVSYITESVLLPDEKLAAYNLEYGYQNNYMSASVFNSSELANWTETVPDELPLKSSGSAFENSILTIFSSVVSIENYNLRTALSKVIENNIVSNTQLFTTDEKEVLLGVMAIGRYSNYYWTEIAPTVGEPSDPTTQWNFRDLPRGWDGSVTDMRAYIQANDYIHDNGWDWAVDPVSASYIYGANASDKAPSAH